MESKMKKLLFVAAIISMPSLAFAQPYLNPSRISFKCPDHDRDTSHEVDIVDSAGKVIQTFLLADPPADENGDVIFDLNVQPVNFGNYMFVARAVVTTPTATLKSADSEPSPVWNRVPGRPSRPEPR